MMKIFSPARHKNYIHVWIWGIFIFYETIIVGLIYGVFSNPITYAIHYAVIIYFFYFLSDKCLPWIFSERLGIWWKIPSLLLALAGYILLHYLADCLLIAIDIISHKGKYPLDRNFLLRNLFRGIYFMMFSSGYYIFKIRQQERIEKEELRQQNFDNQVVQQKIEQELAETRNAYLKAQINPHFLFNTLDFVYHSISSNPIVASEAIIHLSRMMRFAIDADKQGLFINLGEELAHVKTFFKLFKLRKPNDYFPEVIHTTEITKLEFIPLIILTIAENMIKHGDFSHPELHAHITITKHEKHLEIICRNPVSNSPNSESNHLGLENIHKRLIFAYGPDVSFQYHIGIIEFELQIIVPMTFD